MIILTIKTMLVQPRILELQLSMFNNIWGKGDGKKMLTSTQQIPKL